MNTSFRISLLYLLLIIPQHNNSPLPVMESWLQKDQDDGYVQRDMTSSLTGGDESFGSAHQTYQNSLIRRKKADNSENSLPMRSYRSLGGKFVRSEKNELPSVLFDGRYINNHRNGEARDSDSGDAMFADFQRSRMSNLNNENMENMKPLFLSRNNKDKYVDVVPSKDVMIYNNRMNSIDMNRERRFSPINGNVGKGAKRSLCKRFKERYGPSPGEMQSSLENQENSAGDVSLQDGYVGMYDERIQGVGNQEYKEVDSNKQEDKGVFEGNEYYDAGTDQLNDREDLNAQEDDYSQVLTNHGLMHKRDENKQQVFFSNKKPAENLVDGLKYNDKLKSLTSDDSISLEAVKQDVSSAGSDKAHDIDNVHVKNDQNANLVWKLNANPRFNEAQDSMKHTQENLKKTETRQQKSAPENKEGLKRDTRDQYAASMTCEKKKVAVDEKRLKREDEDEQKNMKTGTDEGGGGEYEDEEGKGHKDEEEYYEDAEISEEEPRNEIQTSDDLNQKFIKREAFKESEVKSNKDEVNNNENTQDYELSLENAPMENAEKMRKNSFRSDGGKTKKNCERKGVKIWDQWGKWSSCSVTCGVGRSTRWRHCIGGGCAQGEKEAQIKRCTNPAC